MYLHLQLAVSTFNASLSRNISFLLEAHQEIQVTTFCFGYINLIVVRIWPSLQRINISTTSTTPLLIELSRASAHPIIIAFSLLSSLLCKISLIQCHISLDISALISISAWFFLCSWQHFSKGLQYILQNQNPRGSVLWEVIPQPKLKHFLSF